MTMVARLQTYLAQVGIGVRVAVLTIATILLTIAVFVTVSMMVQQRQALELIRIHTDHLSQSIEQILRFSMLENRQDEIRRAITRLSQSNNIVAISLINHRGTIIYASPDSLTGRTIARSSYECAGCHIAGSPSPLPTLSADKRFLQQPASDIARAVTPIYTESSCYSCHAHAPGETVAGIIDIAFSTHYTQQTLMTSHSLLILYSIGIATVVLLILIYFHRRWIGKPVAALIQGTQTVAGGDLGHTIAPGVAELGDLARAFNTMQSKLQSSQRQLIMSEKLASIGKMAAAVAHEINTPLTGILSFTEGLMADTDTGDPKQQDYAVIRRETLRCRKIVRNLLDFTRQEKPEPQPACIRDIIEQVVHMVDRQALFTNITIISDIPDTLPELLVDSGQLQQVFLNLLVNAAEAMPDGGTITIAARPDTHHRRITVTVRDTGTGIPESALSRIFDPFFSTKSGKTNGLGLSVAWSILEQHRGQITVESMVGKGTTFTIRLPVQ